MKDYYSEEIEKKDYYAEEIETKAPSPAERKFRYPQFKSYQELAEYVHKKIPPIEDPNILEFLQNVATGVGRFPSQMGALGEKAILKPREAIPEFVGGLGMGALKGIASMREIPTPITPVAGAAEKLTKLVFPKRAEMIDRLREQQRGLAKETAEQLPVVPVESLIELGLPYAIARGGAGLVRKGVGKVKRAGVRPEPEMGMVKETTFRSFVESRGYDWKTMKTSHPDYPELLKQYRQRRGVTEKPAPKDFIPTVAVELKDGTIVSSKTASLHSDIIRETGIKTQDIISSGVIGRKGKYVKTSDAENITGIRQPAPTKTKPVTEKPPVKEPWEMTRGDWYRLPKNQERISKPGFSLTEDVTFALEGEHYGSVKQALSEGKPVPLGVLKDYPELAKAKPKVEIPKELEGLAEYEIINSRLQRVWGKTFKSRQEAQKFLEKKITASAARTQFMVQEVAQKTLPSSGRAKPTGEVKLYAGVPVPEMVKEVTRLTDQLVQKAKAKPEIRFGVQEAKTAMIEHDRNIRDGEWVHRKLKRTFEETVPDKNKQLTIIHAVQQKRNPKYYNQLTPQEKGTVKWMELELDKLEAFNREHKITNIKAMPEGVRYVPGSWKNPATGEPYPMMYGKFSKGLPQAKQKVFSTYETGMKTGAEMATTNLGDIIGGAWESLTRAHQSRQMFKSLHNVGAEKGVEIVLRKGKQPKPIRMIENWRLLEKQGLKEDYTWYSHPSLDKAIIFKDAKGSMVRIQGAIGVRNELFPFVKAYIESPRYGNLANLNFVAKNLKLGLSLFHPMQLAMQELANWRVPVVNIPKGLRRIAEMDETTRILHKEGFDMWKGYEDVGYRNQFFDGATKMGRTGNIVAWPVTKIRDFIFNIVQPGMKTSFAYAQYNKLLPKYLKKGLSKEVCARDVVRAADGHFSHSHYKRDLLESSRFMVKLYYMPGAKKFWQAALLSPRWQQSHLVIAKNVTKSFVPDRAIKKLGLQELGPIKAEYRKYALGAAMIVGAVDLYNVLMTQLMDGKGRHIWQNPPGRGFSVRSPWNEPSYTMLDKNGKERTIKGGPAYYRPLKSIYEVAEWASDPVQKLSYKLSPAVAAIGRQLFPSRYQQQYKGIVDIPKRSLDFILDVGTPISAARTTMVLKGKREWYAAALPFVGFPTAKLNIKDTKNLYYDNLVWAEYEFGKFSPEWKKIVDELEKYGIKYSGKEYLKYKRGDLP